MSISVSALVITRNEEANIKRALSSLLWADEIVIVDAKSTDQTLEHCRIPGAPWRTKLKIVEREWTGFRDQRNFALDQASHDWVFFLDADEECSPELARKIKSMTEVAPGPEKPAYKVRRQEFFMGKKIKHGIWNPSFQDRFFNKNGIRYVNNVHEYPKYPADVGRIQEPILHDPNLEPSRILDKMNRYTSIEAADRVAGGMKTNAFRLYFAFFAMFWKNYIYYGAWKDGKHGFIISLLEGVSRVVRHVKIWQLNMDKEIEARKK